MSLRLPPIISDQAISYVCAAAICLGALYVDGLLALAGSMAVAAGIAGIEIGKRW